MIARFMFFYKPGVTDILSSFQFWNEDDVGFVEEIKFRTSQVVERIGCGNNVQLYYRPASFKK